MNSPIYKSESMAKVFDVVKRVANSMAPVLLTGETGTGKGVIAEALHYQSCRRSEPLIKVNCAALPKELIESELFGSVKGSFTGSNADKRGLFKAAERGTLFLDELTEMPLSTQSKLLCALQEKVIRSVGSTEAQPFECRIIAATNVSPESAIGAGSLRTDLYYRLNVVTIEVPSLDKRLEDIIPLAHFFLAKFKEQENKPNLTFDESALSYLVTKNYPGNIRQLQNEIHRAVLLKDDVIIAEDLLARIQLPTDASLTLKEVLEIQAIKTLLIETRGNKYKAAIKLGVGRQTFYNKMKRYNIPANYA
jgi:transcriptional regulator with PAS, ATPase and Fis domain